VFALDEFLRIDNTQMLQSIHSCVHRDSWPLLTKNIGLLVPSSL